MALVVLLRGVNVGGHRTFRPTELVRQLKHLDPVNIGAAGTFVIRKPVTRAALRAELAAALPFAADAAICEGRDVRALMAGTHFAAKPPGPDVVRFVSVLLQAPRLTPSLPASFPPDGPWLVRIVARENRFVLGEYRRHMKTVRYMGAADRLFGVPMTMRNWNTMTAIARSLEGGHSSLG